MKILFVTEFFPTGKDLKFSGGVEARVFFVAKNLAKKHHVYVLTSRLPGSKREERMFNFKVLRVGNTRSYKATTQDIMGRLKFIKSAISAASTLNVDLIDSSNFITHFIAGIISHRKNVPSFAWYPDVWIGSWIKNAGLYGIFGELLERLNLLLGAKAYITISKETATKLRKHTSRKIYTIHCGVDEKEFTKKEKKFENRTITCVSRLTKYKNIRTLILAFADLTTKLPNIRLIIIGSGPEQGNLAELTSALHLTNKVKFISNLPRKQLVKTIRSSHIFSLPSYVEGFGIATIEASAGGIPYVNSNISVQKEITHGALGGYLLDPDDPSGFSNRFYRLLTNKPLYVKKSKDAKKLASNYSWEKVSKETEKIYKQVI